MIQKVFAGRLCCLGLGAAVLMAGCGGGFFIKQTPGTPGTTPGTAAGDFVYVANNAQNTLSGFSLKAGALTMVPNSPYTLPLGLGGSSIVLSRSNAYVYVGGLGGITSYAIAGDGSLTPITQGGAAALANFIALETSPDGNWLLGLDALSQTVYVYQINQANGLLVANGAPVPYAAPGPVAVSPLQMRMSPDGTLLVAALGGSGDVLFTFNTGTGLLTPSANLAEPPGYNDNAVTFDTKSTYVYFSRGGLKNGASGVVSYRVGSGGSLTPVQSLIPSGNAPYALLLDATGAYLYTANRGDATISGYTVLNGTLTALPGSPYASGRLVTALARDNSGKYVLAAAVGGSPDVTLYSFDATQAGRLNSAATVASGVDPAGATAIAATR